MDLQTNSPREAHEMLSTKFRTTIATLVAACSFGAATLAPAVSHADKNNYGYQKTVGKRRWLNTCGNAQISYTKLDLPLAPGVHQRRNRVFRAGQGSRGKKSRTTQTLRAARSRSCRESRRASARELEPPPWAALSPDQPPKHTTHAPDCVAVGASGVSRSARAGAPCGLHAVGVSDDVAARRAQRV